MPRNRGSSSLDAYLAAIRRHPLLTREEEHIIALQMARTGSATLAARLVNANLRLVVKIAREYQRTSADILDLIQEGNLGLLQAVQKYDPHRGVKLSTYAGWWIRAYILRVIHSHWHLVKMCTSPAHRRVFYGLRREREKLEKEGREADPGALAAALGVSERDLSEVERLMLAPCVSLDAPLRSDGDGDRALAEVLAGERDDGPDVRLETDELHGIVRRSAQCFALGLAEREQAVLRDRLYSEEPATLVELAGRFGVTCERVRQIEKHVKKGLRRRLKAALGNLSAFQG